MTSPTHPHTRTHTHTNTHTPTNTHLIQNIIPLLLARDLKVLVETLGRHLYELLPAAVIVAPTTQAHHLVNTQRNWMCPPLINIPCMSPIHSISGCRSFALAATIIWNYLATPLRCYPSISTFLNSLLYIKVIKLISSFPSYFSQIILDELPYYIVPCNTTMQLVLLGALGIVVLSTYGSFIGIIILSMIYVNIWVSHLLIVLLS